MIHYLNRKEIDIAKYDACIDDSLNSRIYAYSWYLDIVADNWDALVLDDYKAVMPLPWRSKYFIKYVYPPAWTQQLGVFYRFEINANLTKEFIKAIPRKFKKVTIQFNYENDLSLFETEKRVNYILDLNKPYEEIYKGFNNNRKRDLKKVLALNYIIDENVGAKTFLDFYLNESKNYQLRPDQITTLKTLLSSNDKAIHIWGIRDGEKLIASLVWLKDNNRITYLLPIATRKAKEKGLPTLLISKLVAEFQKNDLLIDFEGSMIDGVGSFYKSFGSKKEHYFNFKKYFFV